MTEKSQVEELSRRQFMSKAAKSYLGVSLLPMLGGTLATPAFAQAGAARGKAKSVIYLFMSGGMSHLDTFDLKPKRKEVQGPVEALATKADGIVVSHFLPKTAQVMDKVCVINSMNSTQGAHEQGQYLLHTSYAARGTIKHPALGSWILRLGGRINKEIPGYVAVDVSPEHSSGGFLGPNYSAAPIGSAEEGLKDSRRSKEVSEENFTRRLSLADRLNGKFHERYASPDVKAYEDLYKEAITLMNSKDLKAFDTRAESEETRNLYGSARFAQGCLLARRLVEHGVRFIEVELGGWDTHYDNFSAVEGRCREFDQAYAALISDLDRRGMLNDTLVVVATEFGRSPEIQADHKLGRDHHPSAFTCLLAGGGVKGGYRYGETDSKADKVKDKPVTLPAFNATIAHALGIDSTEVVVSPSRRPFVIGGEDKEGPVLDLFA
jgi:hypothetical protein